MSSVRRLPDDMAARSRVYGLLSRLWLREVDRSLLQELRSPALRDALKNAGGHAPVGDEERLIEELAVDYCQLFIGPSQHLPPFQSVWQSGQFQSATTASMKSFIEVIHYDVDRLPPGLMLDHLGVQLDVMGCLLEKLSIWPAGAEDLDQGVELAKAFFERHLKWPGLLEAAVQRAETEFYRSSIAMTRDFLESESSA